MRLNKALISAGGFGTRMRELTQRTPKPMLLLQGKPILEYSIDLCKKNGINDIAISVHYLPDAIRRYFGDGSRFGVSITYIEEPKPMGTAGALNLNQEWFSEPFMMCNADELKDIDLREMFEMHQESGGYATVALTRVADPWNYGVVELEGSKVKRFVEKPKKGKEPSNLINAGLYILDPRALQYVPRGASMIETDVFPHLAASGRLFGYEMDGQWFDTGTLERYAQAHSKWRGFTQRQAPLHG